jgi:hypothetical protein
MNDEVKGFGRKWPQPIRGDIPVCLERLRKTTNNISQDSRGPGRDSNRTPPKYEARALPLGELAWPLICFYYAFVYDISQRHTMVYFPLARYIKSVGRLMLIRLLIHQEGGVRWFVLLINISAE